MAESETKTLDESTAIVAYVRQCREQEPDQTFGATGEPVPERSAWHAPRHADDTLCVLPSADGLGRTFYYPQTFPMCPCGRPVVWRRLMGKDVIGA